MVFIQQLIKNENFTDLYVLRLAISKAQIEVM